MRQTPIPTRPTMISIHDPIHGTIDVTREEIKLIDSRPFQRLRYIKQLGFSEFAFPGATHSRYAHSLGAMRVATSIIERVLDVLDLVPHDSERVRQSVRLAVLFHDLGHPPMSHVSEQVMPKVEQLNLRAWVGDTDRQATHEDYTVKLLVDSELSTLIDRYLGDVGVSGARLAALVTGKPPPGDEDAFIIGGCNILPLLNQIVSSELDADRMDYLRRDAYYCGVSYGNFDHQWLTKNVTTVQHEGQWVLALRHKGVWAFENFLLARYHMFLSVYFHHTGICFDYLLGRYFESGEYTLPADSEAYLNTDDVQLIAALRASSNPWAQNVIRRRSHRLLVETHEFGDNQGHARLQEALTERGINHFFTRSKGVLSKYFRRRDHVAPLFVVEPELGRTRRIEDYTPLYRRFEDVVGVERIYCSPDQFAEALTILEQHRS